MRQENKLPETTVMKVARALYELENDQPYVLSWADASKSESMLEYYVEQAECALLASGLPAAIEARDKALERVKALEAALKPFAKIEVPRSAESGTWVARTLHCNDQVTAHSVWQAREALGRHKDTQHGL